MGTENQRKLAVTGGLFSAIYLTMNNVLPNAPELLMGLTLGLGLAFLVLGLLPGESWRKLRRWRHSGE